MELVNVCWLIGATVVPALLVAWISCFIVRRWAEQWGLLDQPNHRKVHVTPTPLGGGIAIWAGVVVVLLLGVLVVQLSQWPAVYSLIPDFARQHLDGIRHRTPDLLVLLSGATVLMLLGLADDRLGLDWKLRLGVQFVVAGVIVVRQGWTLTAFIPAPALTTALSVLWIAALINAFNMLDNMDGLSAGVAAIASSMLAVFLLFPASGATDPPQLFVAGFLLVLVGGLCGFLLHNRPPARLFMGDAGSYFVGFCVGAATLMATYTGYNSHDQHAILAPLCVMAVPFYDMLSVMWIRFRQGRSVFEADKCHFSHRLVDLGMTKGQAVLTIYLTTATCGLAALLLRRVDWFGAPIVLLLVLFTLLLIHLLESAARRSRDAELASTDRQHDHDSKPQK